MTDEFRHHTRVEVRFDIGESQSLGPRQRARLLAKLGPVVTATAEDTRSQHRNRELALDRLRSAQRRRERYVGPWLPEPILVAPGPEDAA